MRLRPQAIKASAAALLACMAVTACQPSAPQEVAAKYAWVRLSPIAGRPAALYFTLTGAAQPDRLVAVDSSSVQRVELHESMGGMGGSDMAGMSSMKPIDGVDVAPGTSLAFAPGGRHAMLLGIDPAVKPGTPITFRFRFASGRTTTAEARTVGAGENAPAE